MNVSAIVAAIQRIRVEFPMGLVEAKAMWDRHGSYEAMRDELLGLGFRPASDGGESPKARLERLEARINKLRDALDQVRDMFEGEADASMEPGDERYYPNKAMRAVQIVDEALDGLSSR